MVVQLQESKAAIVKRISEGEAERNQIEDQQRHWLRHNQALFQKTESRTLFEILKAKPEELDSRTKFRSSKKF